jgi:hypothetical protein
MADLNAIFRKFRSRINTKCKYHFPGTATLKLGPRADLINTCPERGQFLARQSFG